MRRRTGTAISTPGLTLMLCTLVGATLLLSTGCTRRFYRSWADKEVFEVLNSKDTYPEWELHDYYVYPNPMARFADPTDPDHPPMPPDDVPAWMLSTHPQRPKHVAYIEGLGYLRVLEAWDAQNRALLKQREQEKKNKETPEDLPAPTPRYVEAEPIQLTSSPSPVGGEGRGEGLSLQRPSNWPKNVTITWNTKPTEPGPTAPPVDDPMAAIALAEALEDVAKDAADKARDDWGRHEPFLINLDQSVELGVFNSREFQDRRESLYLTALPVTFERFNFLPQFFATEQVFREWAGRQSNNGKENKWEANPGTTGFSQLFPTGALLTLQLANRTVVNLTGSPKHTISESTLLLDLSQPLLQAGGRAVTLEPLTQAERDLVYELRNFARFHREFYAAIAVGSTFRSSGGGIGVAGLSLGVSGQASFVGYYPTIQNLAVLENNRQQVKSYSGLLRFFQLMQVGGEVSALQVDQIEQQLLSARQDVLRSEVQYQDSLDQFKLQLGLPTNLCLALDFGPLQPLKDHMKRLESVEADFSDILRRLEDLELEQEIPPARLRAFLRDLFLNSSLVRGTSFQKEIEKRYAAWRELALGNELPAQLLLDLAGLPSSPS